MYLLVLDLINRLGKMVVSGIEVVALVATLVSGFSSAQQLVKARKEHLRKAQEKKKLRKVKLRPLDELQETLAESVAALRTEYTRHYRVLGGRFEAGDGELIILDTTSFI